MATKERNVFINPNNDNKRITNNDEESDNEDSDERKPQGIVRIFSKFADKCSVSGMPFITQAENRLVRIIWSFLLLAAFGLMTFHLYKLVITYFEYKKQTQVQLSFSNLQFPAVTLCNVNPLRMSQRYETSLEMTEFIDNVDPEVVQGYIDDWTPDLEELDEDYYDEDYYDEDYYDESEGEDSYEYLKRRRKRQADTPTNKKAGGNRGPASNKKRSSAKVRSNNFFDEFNIGSTNLYGAAIDAFFNENEESGWEAEADTSAFYELERKFRQLFVQEPASTRAMIGHQISDMMLQCSFAGRKCFSRNFTRSLTTRYGNCYTLQYPKFVSRRSGPTDGLQLKLFLETDDYVPGIANGKGVQVVIHDQGTLPFPGEEGLAVKAGTETFIGLRRVEVSRLGSPYGQCTKTTDFHKKYGFKYTRNACQRVCRQERIRNKCGCFDNMEQEVNRALKRPRSLEPCQSEKEIQCALKVSLRFDKDRDACGCYRPCTETSFEKTVTSRIWPNPAFAKLLSSAACKHNSSVCYTLSDKTGPDLREEFVKLVIYYEDLNYEELTESADYELDQFLSDVGGTIGLWIGLSLLSIFEIIHLITDIVLYMCCASRRQK